MSEPEPWVGIEILTFREHGFWIACWRRRDIVAQAPTEKQAVERLLRSIAMRAIHDARDGNPLCEQRPNPKLLQSWLAFHALCHGAPADADPREP